MELIWIEQNTMPIKFQFKTSRLNRFSSTTENNISTSHSSCTSYFINLIS